MLLWTVNKMPFCLINIFGECRFRSNEQRVKSEILNALKVKTEIKRQKINYKYCNSHIFLTNILL